MASFTVRLFAYVIIHIVGVMLIRSDAFLIGNVNFIGIHGRPPKQEVSSIGIGSVQTSCLQGPNVEG